MVVWGIVGALVVAGAALVVFSLLGKERRTKVLVAGVVILIAGAGVFLVSNPSRKDSVSVGNGSVLVSTAYFNLNVSASQVSKAYVVSLSSWNITIAKRTDGSALGQFRSGHFTLSNGANADILSRNDTNLVLVLNSGTYVILGPQDFQGFLSAFEGSVMQVPSG